MSKFPRSYSQGNAVVNYNADNENELVINGVVIGSVEWSESSGWVANGINFVFNQQASLDLHLIISSLNDISKNGVL